MIKVLLGAMGGIFVGAFLMEVLRRKNPDAVQRFEARAKRAAEASGLPIVVEYELID